MYMRCYERERMMRPTDLCYDYYYESYQLTINNYSYYVGVNNKRRPNNGKTTKTLVIVRRDRKGQIYIRITRSLF